MKIKEVRNFSDIEKIMRFQLQLCVAGKLLDNLVIPKDVLESNIDSSSEKTFIAKDGKETVGFCVVGVKEYGITDPYDPICYGRVLRIVGTERKIYQNSLDVGERDLKKRNALSCRIKAIKNGGPTENLCIETLQSRGYIEVGIEPSLKIPGKTMLTYGKDL